MPSLAIAEPGSVMIELNGPRLRPPGWNGDHMKLASADARTRFASSPVARLATAGADGVPHVVPITFAISDDAVFFAIDHKPKTSWNLRRLRNIRENPHVAVLVDHYAPDWSTLWWSRGDGQAEVWDSGDGRLKALNCCKTNTSSTAITALRGLS